MPSLLRPPSHRGPLIAAGAVVLTVGLATQQLRYDDLGAGWQTLIAGLPAALLLWLSVSAPLEGGRPPAYQSVLLVCGLLLLVPALLHLADALGADFEELPPGTATWVALTVALAAGLLADRRNSAIAAFISGAAAGAALISFAEWVGDPEIDTIRWLLLLLALAYVVVSLVMRGSRPRHSEQLVNAAGLAILLIGLMAVVTGLFGFLGFGEPLSGFWELVIVAAGFGLIAYAAADRAPGPAYLGTANLAAFAVLVSLGADRTLQWWPLLLLLAGGLLLAAGLRPARPLPPEPGGYRRDELPAAARVEGDETVFRVRAE